MNRAGPPVPDTLGFRSGVSAVWLNMGPNRRAAIALVAALLVCAAVRLPLFTWDSGDDTFFMQGARLWLGGHLPYVATFDIKPPGVFRSISDGAADESKIDRNKVVVFREWLENWKKWKGFRK